MSFQKGYVPWNKNKKWTWMSELKKGGIASEETRNKMSKSQKARPPRSIEWCEKLSKALVGKPKSAEHTRKNSEAHKGWKPNDTTRRKMSLSKLGNTPGNKGKRGLFKHTEETKNKLRGKNHYNWKDGASKNLYPREFNAELKLKIRQRDNFTCCLCGRTEREELEELNRVLAVNHIDFDKNNCKENNLNTLCVRCNVKINRDREYWTDYFKN